MVTAGGAEFRTVGERSSDTTDRLDWLSTHLDRPGSCDEAAEQAGGPPGDILAFVGRGMDREMREVFEWVHSKLEVIAGARTRTLTDSAADPNADAPGGEPGAAPFDPTLPINPHGPRRRAPGRRRPRRG
jgi:hypothetical protein